MFEISMFEIRTHSEAAVRHMKKRCIPHNEISNNEYVGDSVIFIFPFDDLPKNQDLIIDTSVIIRCSIMTKRIFASALSKNMSLSELGCFNWDEDALRWIMEYENLFDVPQITKTTLEYPETFDKSSKMSEGVIHEQNMRTCVEDAVRGYMTYHEIPTEEEREKNTRMIVERVCNEVISRLKHRSMGLHTNTMSFKELCDQKTMNMVVEKLRKIMGVNILCFRFVISETKMETYGNITIELKRNDLGD